MVRCQGAGPEVCAEWIEGRMPAAGHWTGCFPCERWWGSERGRWWRNRSKRCSRGSVPVGNWLRLSLQVGDQGNDNLRTGNLIYLVSFLRKSDTVKHDKISTMEFKSWNIIEGEEEKSTISLCLCVTVLPRGSVLVETGCLSEDGRGRGRVLDSVWGTVGVCDEPELEVLLCESPLGRGYRSCGNQWGREQ